MWITLLQTSRGSPREVLHPKKETSLSQGSFIYLHRGKEKGFISKVLVSPKEASVMGYICFLVNYTSISSLQLATHVLLCSCQTHAGYSWSATF